MSKRIYPLGFSSTVIPAKGSVRVAVDLKICFTAEWLVVPATVGEFFEIENIRVNGDNILERSTDGIAFSEFVKEKVKLKIKTGRPMHGGKEVAIYVTNTSDTDHNFTACLMGHVPSFEA
jgi:hypothetical protein